MEFSKCKKVAVSRIANIINNRWNLATTKNSIKISMDGLNATMSSGWLSSYTNVWHSVSAEKGFAASEDSSGPVLFYFEVTNLSSNKQ
jgi:hypothetical protein